MLHSLASALLLRLCALLLVPAYPGEGAQEPLPAPEAPAPRIVVIGASLSAGFDLRRSYGAYIDLSHVVRAALLRRYEVEGLGNSFLFTNPHPLALQQVQAARALEPSIVLALDFPFWFGYGHVASEEARLELLERGLALLEELAVLEIPIVVGDFPDMRAATRAISAYGFAMLQPGQVPEPATLERLNARLAEWAAKDPRRVLVSLARFHGTLTGGGAVELRSNRWTGADLGRLLLEDQLHPTVDGCIALALLALDGLARAGEGLDAAHVVWDAAEVRARLDASVHGRRPRAPADAHAPGDGDAVEQGGARGGLRHGRAPR